MNFRRVLGGVWGFLGVSGALFGVFLWSLYRQCFPNDVLGAPGLVLGAFLRIWEGLEAQFVVSRDGFG